MHYMQRRQGKSNGEMLPLSVDGERPHVRRQGAWRRHLRVHVWHHGGHPVHSSRRRRRHGVTVQTWTESSDQGRRTLHADRHRLTRWSKQSFLHLKVKLQKELESERACVQHTETVQINTTEFIRSLTCFVSLFQCVQKRVSALSISRLGT